MKFYITDELGNEQMNGRRFATLEEATKAANRSARLSASRATHRSSAYREVVEAIPGAHKRRYEVSV